MLRPIFRSAIPAGLLALSCCLPAAAKPSRPATLSGKSTPAGAAVSVDGYPEGQTPDVVQGLAPGSHIVTVTASGYQSLSRTVKLRSGQHLSLKLKLTTAPVVTPDQKDARRAYVRSQSARIRDARAAGLMSFTTPGLLGDLGLGLGGGGASGADPTTGLYSSVDFGIDDSGDVTLTVSYFLDEALTQPAGQLVLDLGLTTVTETYSFTAGPLAGASGQLTIVPTSDTAMTLTADGTNPDGSTFHAVYTVTLTDTNAVLTGTVDTTVNGTTTHWTITATATGQEFRATTSDGYTLDLRANADGSGTGTLTDGTNTVLATFTWDASGNGTITYSDGSAETFSLWGP